VAELLPAALGWIDAKKRAALRTLTDAIAEAKASPGEAAINALRGTGRGALSLAEMAAMPMAPQAAGVTDQLLPGNGSAVGDVAEFLGPPMKLGGKAAVGLAGMAALPLKGALDLGISQTGKKILPAIAAHPNMDFQYEQMLAAGHSPEDAFKQVKEGWKDQTTAASWHTWKPQGYKGDNAEPLPKIEFPAQGDLGLNAPPQPLDPLLAAHGLDPANVAKVQRYTREQPHQILGRMEDAQRNATEQLGLSPGNTSRDRALAMGYPDIGEPENWLMRGSKTPRAELKTPVEAGVPSAHSPRQMDVVFASEPESSNYLAYGHVHTPMVSKTPYNTMFDPASLDHQEAFIKRFDELHPSDDKNLGLTGQEIVDEWKEHAGGPQAAWDAIETHPGVAATIKDLGFPGFKTYEHGSNRAVFDPTDMRHPLAAFDPAQANKRNLFASFGPVSALAALLAAKGLPVSDEQPQ
jgi:hypothetical protein